MLSLDVGRRRIGLAGCDPLGITVTPLTALHRGRFDADLVMLQQLCKDRRVQGLVVGLPLDATGQPTSQAEHCRRYGKRLAEALQLPLAWVNEHCSTWAAGERHGLIGDRMDGWTVLLQRCCWNSGCRRGRSLNRSSHSGRRGHRAFR